MAEGDFSTDEIELLTIREIMGLLRLSYRGTLQMVHKFPPNAVIRRRGKGNGFLVHAWALAKPLQMAACPGCGREWPEGSRWAHFNTEYKKQTQ